MPSLHLADLIRAAVRAPADHPCDPEEIARALGYEVVWADRDEIGAADGFALPDELHVARSGTPARDRWTLIHELAHAEAKARDLPWQDERLVDRCAAELLMPLALVARHVEDGLDLPRLAAECGTSLEASARRAIEIAPGCAAVSFGDGLRAYSTLRSPSRRLSRIAAGLAVRCRSARRSKRLPLPSWTARGWIGPDGAAGISVILRP